MYKIIPTVQEKDKIILTEKIYRALKLSNQVHLDVIDGSWVDNYSALPSDWPELPISSEMDVHLMVSGPERYFDFLNIKPIKTIIIQFEAVKNLDGVINQVKKMGKKTGIALDLDTKIGVLDKLGFVPDIVLLMAIKTGWSGQKFNPNVLPKIQELRNKLGNYAEIAVDGGIDERSIKMAYEAGANIFYSNSYFWKNPEQNLSKLNQVIKSFSKDW